MKKIKYVLISLSLFICFSTYVCASGVSISGVGSVTKGNNVANKSSVIKDENYEQ